ncbi:hypothetical protein MMC09_003839 [Bachmanniomyces sp. S44760]|nr:hypothetical protein [Bachmanniomyces sp. S44760]
MSTISPPEPRSYQACRKQSTSPLPVARFSPYKLLRKSASTPDLTGQAHSHPNPPTPADDLSSTCDAPRFTHAGDDSVPIRHVKLDFELYRDHVQCVPSTAQSKAIMALFPTCYKLSFSPPFLILTLTHLPPKPWPVTVAGIPLYLTTNPTLGFSPMNKGLSGHGPKVEINATIQLWRTPGLETFKKLFRVFRDLGADVQSIQWAGWCLLVIGAEEPQDWKTRLPFQINKIRVGYIWDAGSIEETAIRRTLPTNRVSHREVYANVRPEITITSCLGTPDTDMVSTSEVCLRSPCGKTHTAEAGHGFPGGVGEITFHDGRWGTCTGEVAKMLFGQTDIALAELVAKVPYSRETFSKADAPVEEFSEIAKITQLHVGEPIFMDTPPNSRYEGTVLVIDVLEIPTRDEPAETNEYVITAICFFGSE